MKTCPWCKSNDLTNDYDYMSCDVCGANGPTFSNWLDKQTNHDDDTWDKERLSIVKWNQRVVGLPTSSCPFCGEDDVRIEMEYNNAYVCCTKCGAAGPYVYLQDIALDKWADRTD